MLITAIAADAGISAGSAEHELADRDPLMLMLSTFTDDAWTLITLSRGLELLLETHIDGAWRDALGSGEVVAKVLF